MKNYSIFYKEFIVLLPDDLQIYVRNALLTTGLTEDELEDAMNSRLGDLEDTIHLPSLLEEYKNGKKN
ncbi:hypothetical protein [Lysinibacillus sphaericus]|uniref:hypothetical protein n=1 Tax=Lysinibacillus sphaericus TaxID=1421 RepID=UPI0004D6A4BB|nr:hypothetical protein [Lysinibacillus sphaericus]KEK10206.1 hypothetical protein EP18_18705 [Lysinibacillus sphaericus]KEK11111.1 hypothetical protein EP18_14145 [Lysinibacillus sphaericus]PIJ95614.1 hypothetical protein CTN02_22985 [Lysinibacillus sphaericus]